MNETGLSSVGLAWLGDAVFEVLVRMKIAEAGDLPVDQMFTAAKSLSNARAQSEFYAVLEPVLTEEEAAVMRRGRNAKTMTRAKNANIGEYRRATGVEALFGYLVLNGRVDRVFELFGLVKE